MLLNSDCIRNIRRYIFLSSATSQLSALWSQVLVYWKRRREKSWTSVYIDRLENVGPPKMRKINIISVPWDLSLDFAGNFKNPFKRDIQSESWEKFTVFEYRLINYYTEHKTAVRRSKSLRNPTSYNVIIVTPDVSSRFPTGIFCDDPVAKLCNEICGRCVLHHICCFVIV
jgi:hypothetical protein